MDVHDAIIRRQETDSMPDSTYQLDDDLQQQWSWPERYGNQPEILEYVEHVADRFDLRRDIRFDTRVLSAVYDRATNLWTLRSDRGGRLQAPICVMATGNLSTPRVPDYPGLETFKGRWYMGANVPGKPRVFMPYVGGVHAHKRECDEVAGQGYPGVVMTPAATEPGRAAALAGDD
jgi:hypothetical protein